MKYNTLVTRVNIFTYNDNPIFGESVTCVELEDEAGGPFIVISQPTEDAKAGTIRINDIEELTTIYETARALLLDVKKYKES